VLLLEGLTASSLSSLGRQLLTAVGRLPEIISDYYEAAAQLSALIKAMRDDSDDSEQSSLTQWLAALTLTELLGETSSEHMRIYAAGELVIREGERGDVAYLVRSGSCEVYRRVDGRRETLRVFRRGEVFGEGALLDGERRSASVIAKTNDTKLELIDRSRFSSELEGVSPWIVHLIETLGTRVRQG
jgi:hypothetical protein